ncbi:DUF4192 domain-containing protein [Dietzia cercidiphylli]|uniref:DUF4192 domain-containing protein n=1 Tax=Dietzia cercidiphylli TaxID=498199 RepID=UPI00223B1D69|nr:DUF4192 domain-containing protein [Dietzia cercidiphylli]MCT1516526.1 DUF4192 domain-containing protein [Dietzia cercidiphylli]
MSRKRVISIESAADVAAASVSMLGVIPTDSVVFLPMTDSPVVRVDAPSDGDEAAHVAQALRSAVEMSKGAPVYLVAAFCGREAAERAFDACSSVEAAQIALCVRVESDAARMRLDVGVYGEPEPWDVMTHPLCREAILSGALTMSGHDEMDHLFVAADPVVPGTQAQAAAVERVRAQLDAQRPQEVAEVVWKIIKETAGADRALTVGEVALLSAVTDVTAHRDAVFTAADWDMSAEAAEAFRYAGSAVTGQWAGQAFTMAAVMYKGAERSIHARNAIEAAQRLAPDYALAPLIAKVLQIGVRPEKFRELMSLS